MKVTDCGRLPGGGLCPARAEMGVERERAPGGRKRDALTHLSDHQGSAQHTLFCPLPFCPLLPPICGHFLAPIAPFCNNLLLPVLVWPSGTGGSERIVVENGKQGSLHRENILSPHPIEISSSIGSTANTEFKRTGTLTPEQRGLITAAARPQRVVCPDRGLST